MTINRRLLYWGVFFITTGALVLAITGDLVTGEALGRLFRLWPLLVIALGVGVLLRATPLRTAGGLVLAIIPGLVLGGLLGAAATADLAAWREVRAPCVGASSASLGSREGSFAGGAAVDLDLAWGDLEVRTAPGTDWRVALAGTPGREPDVDASADELRVASADRRGGAWDWNGCAADDWQVTLPTGSQLDLATEIAAGEATLDLARATIGELDLVVRAADLEVDLGTATAEDISLRVGAGAADLVLPATGVVAVDLDVDAGAARVCAPAGMALRVRADSSLASITTPGLVRVGEAWESPDYATSTHRADVSVAVNVGSVDLNPEGGCK